MEKVTLMDLVGAEAPASVEIRGHKMPVHGMPIGTIARLMRDCPSLAAALSTPGEKVSLDMGELLKQAPDAVGMLIAAGLGHFGDREWEAAANKLPVLEQLEVLTKIIEVTMPGGYGPFVAQAKALAKAAGVDLEKYLASSTSSP